MLASSPQLGIDIHIHLAGDFDWASDHYAKIRL